MNQKNERNLFLNVILLQYYNDYICKYMPEKSEFISTTSSQHYHHFFHHSYPDHQLHRKKPTQPPTDHQVATATLSLILPALLSPLQPFLLPLTAEASRATGQTTTSRPRPPRQATSSSLFCLFLLSSSSWLLHAEFISPCSN